MPKLLSNDLNTDPATDYQISEDAHALVHDLNSLSIDIQRVAGRLDNSRHMLRALANEAAILTNHLGDHL